MSLQTLQENDVFRAVEVFDPNGHRSIVLEGLRGSASVAEIRARAITGLRLPQEFEWNVRQPSMWPCSSFRAAR